MTRRRRHAAAALLVVVSVLSREPSLARAAPASSSGMGKAACLSAHEAAQKMRREKKLREARQLFAACARDSCPVVLRKECSDQIAAVAADTPTVVFEARDEAGHDTTDVRVLVDGSVVADTLSGASIEIDPGEHTFRFERTTGTVAPIEQKVLVLEGDKNRKIAADFSAGNATDQGAASGHAESGATVVTPASGGERKAVPPGAYVLGGVAIAGLAAFGLFAYLGKHDEKDLAGSCAPHCASSDVSPVKRDYAIADVSLGVALVAGVAAVIVALPALRGVGVTPVRGGGAMVSGEGRF